VLLLTAALVVPPFIDWSGYRADFEREASTILGRPVKVAGEVKARLLPFPSVTFSDVRVGADPDHPVMTVQTFSMDAELMPFLRGQLLIFDMRVEKPSVTISLDGDGKIDWAIRPSTPLDPKQIRVERLSVTDGTVTLRDAVNGKSHVATDLDAVLSATSLAGPWQADGTFNLDGQKLGINLVSGAAKPDGSLHLRARVSPDAIPAAFETDGDVVLKDGRLTYGGDFSLRSSDVAAQAGKPAANAAKGAQKAAPEKPFFSDLRLTGKFFADRNRFDVSEFRMEQGPADSPYVVNGKAFIDYGAAPHFSISADGQQIFLGPVGAPEDQQNPQTAAPAAVPFTERIAIVRRVLEQLPIPTIPGSVDLRLPAVIAGGTTIRSVTVKAEPDHAGWNIRQFAADLPGRTRVEAQGRLSVGSNFGFAGNMLVASRQPSGLASWLNEKVDDSIRKLDGAGFSGKVTLRDGMQKIDDLEIGLGHTTLKGSLSRQVSGEAEPVVDLNLSGGAVDSDALQALVAFFASGDGLSLLDRQALKVGFKAGPVRYQDMEAAGVDISARLQDGRLDFDRLMVDDVAGATLTATGRYEPFAAAPSGSLDATVLSGDLSRFISIVANRYPQVPLMHALSVRAGNFPGLFSDSRIDIVANAIAPTRTPAKPDQTAKGARKEAAKTETPSGGEISFSVSGKAGGMKLDLSGTASGGQSGGTGGEPLQMQLNGTASSQQGEAVLALIGLPALPLGLAGELTADLTMQGAPDAGMRTQLKLTAPDGAASADGVISLVGGDIAASGKAQVKSADLQPFMATLGYALPGYGEGLAGDLSSDFQFAKGILRFPNLAGTLGGEKVSARLEADFADDGQPQLKGEAKLASLDLASLAAVMLGPEALEPAKATRQSVWPRTAFADRPTLPVVADVKLNVARARAGNFGVITDFSTRLQKTVDSLSLSEFAGNWAGGYLVGGVTLRDSDRNALLSTDLKWTGASLAGFYRTGRGAAPLGGTLKAAVTLNGSGNSAAALVASLAGTASFDVEGFTVGGLNGTALPGMVAAADAIGDAKGEGVAENSGKSDAARFDAIAQAAAGQGHFSPGNVHFDVALAGGVARLADFNLNDGNAGLSGDMQLDLSTLALGGNSALTYNDGESMGVGIAPQVGITLGGSYFAPTVHFDRQQLVQFLTQRSLQREQQRVEAMQAALMEKQRLHRQLALYEADAAARQRAQQEEETRRRAEAARRAEQAAKSAVPPAPAPDTQQKAPAAPAPTLPRDSIEDFLKTLPATPPPAPAPVPSQP